MTYQVLNETSQNPALKVIMNISNVDISSWNTTDGSQGLWAGIGYNTEKISGSDFSLCYYNFTNSTNDRFNCTDGSFSDER
jgi:hypothetical protein